MDLLALLVVVGSSFWVLHDARNIGIEKGQLDGIIDMGPWGWFFWCLIVWVVWFPIYLFKRGEYKSINRA